MRKNCQLLLARFSSADGGLYAGGCGGGGGGGAGM